MRHPLKPSAFTLIELMIAIGLGTAIVVVAMAGVRVAAQATTMANRLSTENSMLRAGILSSLEQVDFWTQYDNPDNASEQRLRGIDAARGLGLPFAPFKDAWPKDRPSAASPAFYEPDAKKWSFHDPETWWRGCAAQRCKTDVRFGRYAIFASARSPATVCDAGFMYGSGISVPHTWLYDQMRGFERALGWYGRDEYLPNAIQLTAFYDDFVGGGAEESDNGGIPKYLTFGGWGFDGFRFLDSYYPYYFANVHDAGSFAVLPVTASTAALNTTDLVNLHRRCYSTDYLASPASVATFTDVALSRTPLLREKPEAWPEVRVSVLQSFKMLRFHALCKIHWTSPLTGVESELSFSAFGTSLRGARQQRGRDGGWAGPGDPTLDSP